MILTAGHCAEDTTTGSLNPAAGYGVVTDSLDWTDASTRQLSGVSRVIVYPGYNPTTGQGDAALLCLLTTSTVLGVAAVCFALRLAPGAFPAGGALLLTSALLLIGVLVALPVAAAARAQLPPAAPISPATGRAATALATTSSAMPRITALATTSSAMPRITVRAGQLYAGSVPFRAWGFNWGTGNHMPTLTYLDNPTAQNYQTLAAELQTAKNMGANSMRVYVELSQVMSGPTTVRQSTLTALQICSRLRPATASTSISPATSSGA